MDIIISGNQDIMYMIKNMPTELNDEIDEYTAERLMDSVMKDHSAQDDDLKIASDRLIRSIKSIRQKMTTDTAPSDFPL